jgi:hypothetical protein
LPDLRAFSTGSGWIDDLLGGGHAPRCVYSVRTAMGGGRTTVGSMIAAGAAARFGRRHRREGGPRRLVVFVSFEERAMWPRFRSFGTGIDRGRLHSRIPGGARPPASFRGSGAAEGGWSTRAGLRPAEAESLDVFDDEVGESLVVLNLIGATGLEASVETIAVIVADFCRSVGFECGLVVIDSGELAVRRELEDRFEDSMSELCCYPDRCRTLLAGPLHCPVWILGELPGGNSGRREFQDPRDAHASRLVEGLDACIDLRKGPGGNVVARTSWARDPGLIGRSCPVRLEGAVGRFVRVADDPLEEGESGFDESGATAG